MTLLVAGPGRPLWRPEERVAGPGRGRQTTWAPEYLGKDHVGPAAMWARGPLAVWVPGPLSGPAEVDGHSPMGNHGLQNRLKRTSENRFERLLIDLGPMLHRSLTDCEPNIDQLWNKISR